MEKIVIQVKSPTQNEAVRQKIYEGCDMHSNNIHPQLQKVDNDMYVVWVGRDHLIVTMSDVRKLLKGFDVRIVHAETI